VSRAVALGIVAAAVFAVSYSPTFTWAFDRWFAEGSTYGHGPLVAAIALVAAARGFRSGARSCGERSRFGISLLLAGLGIHMAGLFFRIDSLSGFSFPLALLGACGALGGRDASARARPWIGFLLFAIPLPLKVLYDLSFFLKERSTDVAVVLAKTLGTGLVRDGASLHLGAGETLVVGDACSGIRSLVAFAALAYFYAFFIVRRSFLHRLALVSLAVPAAFLSNALRLLGIVLAAKALGTQRIEGLVHEIAAIPLYLGAFAGLLVLGGRLPGRAPKAADPQPGAPGPYRPRLGRSLAPLGIFLAASVGLFLPRLFETPRRTTLDRVVPREIGGLVGRDLLLTEREIALLGTRDVLYRRYEAREPDPAAIQLAVVRGAGERHVVHPPDACYVGSGYDIVGRGESVVESAEGPLPLGRLTGFRAGEKVICTYTYLSGRRVTASYFRHQIDYLLDALRGGGGRSVLLRVDMALAPEENPREAEARLEAFAATVLDSLRGIP